MNAFPTRKELETFLSNDSYLKRVYEKPDLVQLIIENKESIRKEARAQAEARKRKKNNCGKRDRSSFGKMEGRIIETAMGPCSKMTQDVIKAVSWLMTLIGYTVYSSKPLRIRQHIENQKRSIFPSREVTRKQSIPTQDSNGLSPFPCCDLEKMYNQSDNKTHDEQFNNTGKISLPERSSQGLYNELVGQSNLQNYKDNKCVASNMSDDSQSSDEHPSPYTEWYV